MLFAFFAGVSCGLLLAAASSSLKEDREALVVGAGIATVVALVIGL